MLCDDCKKRPAEIFFKNVLPGGKVINLYLCEACAHKRGLFVANKPEDQYKKLEKLLKEKSGDDDKVICSVCYLSLAEFKHLGRFGCSKCLSTFQPYIKNLIKQIQQSDHHIGRQMKAGSKKGYEVFKLREQLKVALEKEAYEEAAKIRDKLKAFGVENVG